MYCWQNGKQIDDGHWRERVNHERNPVPAFRPQITRQPPENVVNGKAQSRYDIEIPEQSVLCSEHKWKYTYSNGYKHNAIVPMGKLILIMGFYQVVYLFSNRHFFILYTQAFCQESTVAAISSQTPLEILLCFNAAIRSAGEKGQHTIKQDSHALRKR